MSASLLSSVLAVSGLEYALNQSIFPGKIILWTLVMLSLLSWAVILTKAVFYYRSRAADAEFARLLRGSRQPMQLFERNYSDDLSLKSIIYDKGSREVAFQMLGSPERDATFGARLKSCNGLAFHQLEAVREAFRRGEEAASAKLRRGMPFLSAAATGAPFLGLLGMVWILMKSFTQASGETAGLATVAPGVSGALAVMVIALLVATPAIFAQVVLSAANREKMRQLGDFRAEAVRLVERSYVGSLSAQHKALPENSPAANIAAAAAAAALEAKEEAVEAEEEIEEFASEPGTDEIEEQPELVAQEEEEFEEYYDVTAPEPAIVDENRLAEPLETIAATRAAVETPPPLQSPDEEVAAPAPVSPEREPRRQVATLRPMESRIDPATVAAAMAAASPSEDQIQEQTEPDSFILPSDDNAAPSMTGPVYAEPEEAPAPAEQQLEMEDLTSPPRESLVDEEYDTPFAEPELNPIAQQTGVLMARRRGTGTPA